MSPRSRRPALKAVFALLVAGCMSPSTNPSPSGTVTPSPPVVTGPRTASSTSPTGQRPQLTDSARRVRDSVTAFRRDSLMNKVLASIAGQETAPAESVFTNIKIFKGVPAARLVRIMGQGFSPALGVSCGFCHVIGEYDKDDKQPKKTARIMYGMVIAINRDYISQVPVESGRPAPVVNCSTCHRGSTRVGGPLPGQPAPAPRPGS